MLKVTNCKELNPFDHCNIIEHIENKRITSLLNLINNKTVKLTYKHNINKYVIIHRCTKENSINKIQCSYFINNEPISDIVRDTYRDIIEYINPLNFNIKNMEVIA